MGRAGRPREGQHSELEGEAENDLRRRGAEAFGYPRDLGALHRRSIGGEQREGLVDDGVSVAEGAYVAVPPTGGVASVLYESGRDPLEGTQLLQLIEGDVAGAQRPGTTSADLALHRAPCLAICRRQTSSLRRTVKDVGVDVVGAEMFEGALERLLHLDGYRSALVVRQAVILPGAVGELRLHEELGAGHEALRDDRGNSRSHRRLHVVFPLIGRVDTSKPQGQGLCGQPLCLALFPGGAVEEGREGRTPSGTLLGRPYLCRRLDHERTSLPWRRERVGATSWRPRCRQRLAEAQRDGQRGRPERGGEKR